VNVTEFPDLERAREEAAAWVARMDRGLTAAERASLTAWCAASPANTRALRQLTEMWAALDVMRVLPQVLPDAASEPQRRVQRARTPGAVAAIAASVLVATAAAWVLLRSGASQSEVVTAAVTTYATAVGEQREVALADGSSLSMNTGSLVEVQALDGDARELHLLRGEAHFTVAHDASRPFRVRVGGRLVEAVGTAFDIRLHDAGHVEVLVTDGRVKLTTRDVISHADRGDAVTMANDGALRVNRLDQQALSERLAWRDGMIAFTGQPLSQALEEFSRYTPARFVVSDAATRMRPVGGTVPAGDVQSLLDALRTNLGLVSSRSADGSIHIGPGR